MIDNRRKLQIWTSLSLSLLIVLLGALSASVGIRFLRRSLEEQVADDNRVIGETLRIIITQVSEELPEQWSAIPQIQKMLEAIAKQGWVGFACVLDEQGRVLAHPRSEFLNMQVPLDTYAPTDLLGSFAPPVRELATRMKGQTSAYRSPKDIITVQWLPGLMTYLCVHQSIGRIEERILALRQNLVWIGLVFVVVVAAGSWSFVGRLVDRYESNIERSEARNRALVQNSAPIFVVDRSGEILEANPQAAMLCGRRREDLVGSSMAAIWPKDPAGRLDAILRETTETHVTEYDDVELLTVDGRRIPIALRSCAVEYGGREAVYMLARDITETRRAREEILEANRQLRELDQLKSDFLNTVSHELRTPLTSIQWSADSLVALAREQNDATVQKLLGIIQDDNQRLSTLIEQILSFSRVDAGELKLRLRPLQLQAMLSSAVEELRPAAQRKGLQLVLEDISDAELQGDAEQLHRVAANILDNAIKYTPSGGSIRVRAMSGKGDVQIAVADSGIGIPEQDRERVFEKFHRTDREAVHRERGTGLGLAIVRGIVEAHGGAAHMEDTPGGGTTCIIRLPSAGPDRATVEAI